MTNNNLSFIYMEDNKILFDYVKNHKWNELIVFLGQNKNIDLNIKDNNNNYIINYTILYNKPKITSKLIELGARIDILDNDKRTMLYIPIKYNYNDIIDVLIKYDKDTIGETIQNIKDINGNISLNYAIKFKNKYAINKLIKNGSDPNKKNNKGNNSLHLAVYSKDLEFCKIIADNIYNIDDKNTVGDSALSIACNLESLNIVKFLVDKKADINTQDHENEFTPLIYSINQNNKDIAKYLLENGANPNLQDIYGNTALHYCVYENNEYLFNILSSRNNTSFNTYNIDSKIPLHLVFEEKISNPIFYINTLISGSNLNIQNNKNTSCLHYLVKANLWKKYRKELSSKKLDIFLRDDKGKRVIDYINKNDKDDFLELVIDSYLYQLRNIKDVWKEDWENVCDKRVVLNKLTKDEKKILGNYGSLKNDDKVCKNIIKKKLKKLDELTCPFECKNKSYPIKKGTICLNVDKGTPIKFCTYTGVTLDVLAGLIFLLKKYPKLCSTLTTNFIESKNACSHYKSIGLPMAKKMRVFLILK